MEVLPSNPRLAIIGAGAVGGYYGSRLAQAGLDVHFLLRSDLEAVRAQGLHIRSVQGDFHLPAPQIHATTSEIGPCDVVIIALKSTANAALPGLIHPLLHADTKLLTLQNGLGNEEFLADHFGPERVIGGLCYVCINRTDPGVINHSAQGLVIIGDPQGPPRPVTRALGSLLASAGVDCQVSDCLPRSRWLKLTWNIAFNGLAIAAGGVDTSVIMNDSWLRQQAAAIMEEVRQAAAACGHPLPASLVDEHLAATAQIGPYRPSSLIDYMEGRDVEVDSIWAQPLQRARAAGAVLPRLEMLHALISSAVARRRADR
jgi:2-dehydropantoate 2-reductase